MKQDNHQQRPFTSKSNVESVIVENELHDELWKFSDIDELFAQVFLPDNVIDVQGTKHRVHKKSNVESHSKAGVKYSGAGP